MVKNLPANAGDMGSISELGRSPGGGMATHSSILNYVCLFTPMRLTLPGVPGDSSGGLPGNYSNFLAPSH